MMSRRMRLVIVGGVLGAVIIITTIFAMKLTT
jgi:hypothetical protein